AGGEPWRQLVRGSGSCLLCSFLPGSVGVARGNGNPAQPSEAAAPEPGERRPQTRPPRPRTVTALAVATPAFRTGPGGSGRPGPAGGGRPRAGCRRGSPATPRWRCSGPLQPGEIASAGHRGRRPRSPDVNGASKEKTYSTGRPPATVKSNRCWEKGRCRGEVGQGTGELPRLLDEDKPRQCG